MITLRGRVKVNKGKTCDFDLLSNKVSKAWESRGVKDILENEELSKGIKDIFIYVKNENEFGNFNPYYYIELDTTKEFWNNNYEKIMSCLVFEIGYGINEFLMNETRYIPQNTVELPEEKREKVYALIDTLEDLDDVQNVYHNMAE